MTEEMNKKNTVATVGMRFSIIWLILLVTVFLAWFWFPLLFVWFILWIIGLFNKPRGKARVAIIIPLVVFITTIAIGCYIWSSVKTPVKEFWDWAKVQLEQIDEETFDNDRFSSITNEEFNSIFSGMTEDEFKSLLENSTWSNVLEKWSYALFWLLQQGLENSLEKYNSEIDDTENTNEDEENDDIDSEDIEVFTESEQDDIEQILNILE